MSIFAPPAPPKTVLGRYRQLAPKCGLRVSPLCLGAMSIGENWKEWMGSMDKESSFKLLDAFYERGGNFIDTANNYQGEESEEWIGEWMETRGVRDEMVIATKYTTQYRNKEGRANFKANYCGNHYKSMYLSVEDSLKKLRTKYIDVLYMHWLDWTTEPEEIMQGLNNLIKQGKVLYIAVSDTPAWFVVKCNAYARQHGMAQFVLYQGKWSLAERDLEREVLQMVTSEGMGLAPWNVMGGGKFQSKKQIEEKKAAGEKLRSFFGEEQSPEYARISEALESVGNELGVGLQAVALAYVMHKHAYVFPIIGGRKVEHLDANIQALSIELTPAHMKKLEDATDFKVGFPLDFVSQPGQLPNFLMAASGHYDLPLPEPPIKPYKKQGN